MSSAAPEGGVTVKRLHRIDERSFYVRGRCWGETAPVEALTAVTPEGERVELADQVCQLGEGAFAGRFETAFPTRGSEGWGFEARGGAGSAETPAALAPDPLRTLFADVALDPGGATELCERHLHPAITRLAELRRAGAVVAEVVDFGAAPEAPAVAIVVPLLRRVDLIEHQLAQLSADPELAGCELIYVVADPEQAELAGELASELHALYGLPFRLVSLSGPGDLPLACAQGARLARAPRLLFLGSDVLPDRPGWLAALAAALDADPALAAAAPKLLYADRRPLEATGLACFMVDRAAFEEAGGLAGDYGLGEYEASDLSRRLAAAGRELAYVPEAELLHLEGLGAAPEALAGPYARWLHERRWAGQLAEAAA